MKKGLAVEMFFAVRDHGNSLRINCLLDTIEHRISYCYDSKSPTCLSYVRTEDETACLDGYIDGRKNGHRPDDNGYPVVLSDP